MRIQRHDHIVNVLLTWLKPRCTWTTQEATFIYANPHNPQDALGRMNIQAVYEGVLYNIDVSITDPQSGTAAQVTNAALHNGHAAQLAEKRKQNKYRDAPNLIPFILEAGGRWGTIAKQWIKILTNPDEPDDIRSLRYHMSAQLQLGNAAMIKSSYG